MQQFTQPRKAYGCSSRRQAESFQKSGAAALGPLLFSYQGPSQKRMHEMLQKRQRRKQLRHQSKVQRSLTLWSERASDYTEELFKNRKQLDLPARTAAAYRRPNSKLNSAADLKLPTPFPPNIVERTKATSRLRAEAASLAPSSPASSPVSLAPSSPASSPALSGQFELFCVESKDNESRKMRSSRRDYGKLTDVRTLADVKSLLQGRSTDEATSSRDSKLKRLMNFDDSNGGGKSFDELKMAILNDLDNGFESLQFIMQIAPRFMSGMVNSALQQVACDYLWTKTVIEKAFRIWPLAAGSNTDKRLFREVLIQLYKYVTKSLITWLTQHGPSIPEDSPFLQELGKVIELLLKSVQCIAHHGSLRKTHKRLSFRGLFSGRALTNRPQPIAESSNLKKKFSIKSQKRLENAFVEQMKYLRRDIGQRKNSVKCARWLMLAVPHEVQNEPMLLRSDSLASIAPLTSPYEPLKRRT